MHAIPSCLSVDLVALVDVAYKEPELGGAMVDAVVAINLTSGEAIPTASDSSSDATTASQSGSGSKSKSKSKASDDLGGELYFSWWRRAGTDSTEFSDGIYKIQYWATSSGDESDQEYHQNGVTRFWSNALASSASSMSKSMSKSKSKSKSKAKSSSGVAVLGATHKTHGEAVLAKCPFTYAPSEGGGSLLQRFGSPYHYDGTSASLPPSTTFTTTTMLRGAGKDGKDGKDATTTTRTNTIKTASAAASTAHSFGMAASSGDGIVALHNLYHTAYPDGTETLSLFVNEADQSSMSMAWEFVVNLVEEPSSSYDDVSKVKNHKERTNQSTLFCFDCHRCATNNPLNRLIFTAPLPTERS